MNPVSLIIAALSVAGAAASKYAVEKAFQHLRLDSRLEVVTSDGRKISIDASALTREKAEEILHKSTAAAG
jgi:folylpolyglutamate synthase/dihydropteroate synthase